MSPTLPDLPDGASSASTAATQVLDTLLTYVAAQAIINGSTQIWQGDVGQYNALTYTAGGATDVYRLWLTYFGDSAYSEQLSRQMWDIAAGTYFTWQFPVIGPFVQASLIGRAVSDIPAVSLMGLRCPASLPVQQAPGPLGMAYNLSIAANTNWAVPLLPYSGAAQVMVHGADAVAFNANVNFADYMGIAQGQLAYVEGLATRDWSAQLALPPFICTLHVNNTDANPHVFSFAVVAL